jgi:hypothetical protein
MDNIDYPLKLTGCEFAHDLMKGAGFANQQHRRRNRFGYSLFGRPFCPRTIERDSIAHNRTYPGWPVQRATKSPARGETRSRLVSSRYRAAKARRGPAGSPPGRDHPSPRKGLCRRARIWQRFFPSQPEPAGRDHSASSAVMTEVLPQTPWWRGLGASLGGHWDAIYFTVQKFEVSHGNRAIEAIAFLPCDTYVRKSREPP